MNKQSTFLNLDLMDIGKGLIVAVLSTVLTALYSVVQDGTMPTGEEWKGVLSIAVTSALAYLVKNVFSNSEGKPFKSEQSVNERKP